MITLNETTLRKMGANSRKLAVEKFDVGMVIRKYDHVIYKTMGFKQNSDNLAYEPVINL
jgi:hypothetical protein